MKTAARFGRAAVPLLAVAALAFLLGEPHLEGRNAGATLFEIYFKDPFLAYVYFGSIPFFIGLHRAFRLFGLAAEGKEGSPADARTLKACALASVGLVALGEFFLFLGKSDDRAGGVVIGLVLAAGSGAVAYAAAKYERSLSRPA